MPTLAQRAEVLKLARLLGSKPEQFDYLHKLDAPLIRQLRQQATASLFDADRKAFQKVATASKLLPAPVTALIAEKALGPLLCAKIAGLLQPERAVEIARRLNTRYLADVCLELDPRSARDVLEAMPVDRIVEVSRELARRKEYITMGRFVDSLTDDAIEATMDDLRDDEALLRIGFFVEDAGRLSSIIDLLSPERLRNIVQIAAQGEGEREAELWPEALALINSVDEPQRRLMADLAAALDDAAVGRMIAVTQAQGLWPAMLPMVSMMSQTHQRRLINLPALQTEDVLGAVIRAADAANLWPQLLPLVALMDNNGQARAVRAASLQGEAVMARLAESLRALAPAAKK
ncbi:MAG TPA: hypothetical protein VNX47_03265 [Nevskia sp.]|nr:hypothetical protein [Nevskia sp.]